MDSGKRRRDRRYWLLRALWVPIIVGVFGIEAARCVLFAFALMLKLTSFNLYGTWTLAAISASMYMGFLGLLSLMAAISLFLRVWRWHERVSLMCVVAYGISMNMLFWGWIVISSENAHFFFFGVGMLLVCAILGMLPLIRRTL